jgi:hypothetical protein
LKTIACKLVAAIKKNLSINWTDCENVKAKIRATVKRLLRRYWVQAGGVQDAGGRDYGADQDLSCSQTGTG